MSWIWSCYQIHSSNFVFNLVKSQEMIWLKGIHIVFFYCSCQHMSVNSFFCCYRCLLKMQNINYFFFLERVDNIFLLEMPGAWSYSFFFFFKSRLDHCFHYMPKVWEWENYVFPFVWIFFLRIFPSYLYERICV